MTESRQFVKIYRHGERFWCEVLEHIKPGIMRVRVDNNLVGEGHALKFDDQFNIRDRDVLERMTG